MFNPIKKLFTKETAAMPTAQPVEEKKEEAPVVPEVKKLFDPLKAYPLTRRWFWPYGDDLKTSITFTDKASYFQWRDEWKEEYAKVAAELRALRIELGKTHPTTEMEYVWPTPHIVKLPHHHISQKQSRKAALRVFATNLLIIRRESKKEAGRQMQERREQEGFDKAQNYCLENLEQYLKDNGVKE